MERRQRARAVFMAFGTKGDVFPIAALATAFASDQQLYDVILVSHAAYKNLSAYLNGKNISYYSVSSPPVLSLPNRNDLSELSGLSFSEKKQAIRDEHRRGCFSIFERIFENGASIERDIVVINFFALEGWNLAELFHVRCVVAAPYVVPYSVPATFERQFKQEHPHLYRYFQEAPSDQVNWKDVLHWMWPLFTEEWGSWRRDCLNLSLVPFTDPVTSFPMWHLEERSPLLLYGFSKEVVECPGYWPSNIHACGFWFLPMEWQFSCHKCAELASLSLESRLCFQHSNLQIFLEESTSPLLFLGLSSIGSMGYIQNPLAFLSLLEALLESVDYHIILLTAGYQPLDSAIQSFVQQSPDSAEVKMDSPEDGIFLFNRKLFCFSGSIAYSWLFPKCAVAIHHGGSGSTASALHAGIPQIACPFILDQFYWAERLQWLGVSPEPLQRSMLVPESDDPGSIRRAVEGLRKAIKWALSPQVREQAQEIQKKLSSEDGIQEALRVLKEKVLHH